MPGEMVVPASATRIGWKTSFGLTSRASTTPRSAVSTASTVHGRGSAASASRAAASAARPASPSHFSRASVSYTHLTLPTKA